MRITVVLADDEQMVRSGLRLILESEDDIEVVGEAGDGAEALELARRLDPDVVLMDVQMPVMNGIEAVTAIRAQERERGGHIPILAMTAHAAGTDETWCLEAGMDAYLAKPVDLDEFIGTLRQMLG